MSGTLGRPERGDRWSADGKAIRCRHASSTLVMGTPPRIGTGLPPRNAAQFNDPMVSRLLWRVERLSAGVVPRGPLDSSP